MVQIEYVYRLNLFHCPPSEPGLLKAPQKASRTVKEYLYGDANGEEREDGFTRQRKLKIYIWNHEKIAYTTQKAENHKLKIPDVLTGPAVRPLGGCSCTSEPPILTVLPLLT